MCGRQLTAGRLLDLGVADGSKLTLVPVIEAGLVVSQLMQILKWFENTFNHSDLVLRTVCVYCHSVPLSELREP